MYVHVHASQFLRLGIQVSLAIICLFVGAMVGWVALPFFSFLFFFKLVCYAHVFQCNKSIHTHTVACPRGINCYSMHTSTTIQ